MKKSFLYFALALLISLFISKCNTSENHFLKNQEYRNKVHEQFLNRKQLASGRAEQLFSVFEKEGLTTE